MKQQGFTSLCPDGHSIDALPPTSHHYPRSKVLCLSCLHSPSLVGLVGAMLGLVVGWVQSQPVGLWSALEGGHLGGVELGPLPLVLPADLCSPELELSQLFYLHFLSGSPEKSFGCRDGGKASSYAGR